MPVTIQNMTSSYVTITSHVLTAFDLWEQAEALTRKSKGKGSVAVIPGARGSGGSDTVGLYFMFRVLPHDLAAVLS